LTPAKQVSEANDFSKAQFEIRLANEEDSTGILRCLSEAFEPYRKLYTTEAFADTVLNPESLRARMKTMHVIVAVANGEVIGTVAGSKSQVGEGHLRGMAVLPQYKDSGIAAELLAAIEAWLRGRGCTRVTLDTTKPLLAAMKFYEKHGYARSSRVSDFFGMQLIEYAKEIV